MPFNRPTLTELRTGADNDLRAALPGSDPLLRFSNLRILSTILAGMANLLFGFLDWIARMAVPFTSEGEYLSGWAALVDVYQKAATTAGDRDIGAGGQTTFSGCTPTKVVPVGSLLVRGDGVDFITLAEVTIAGDGTAVADVQATEPGAKGNCAVGVILTLGSSLEGIQTNTTVSQAVTGGADMETTDDFRSRMLKAYREPPQGGAESDYEKWALDVAGVTRAWAVGEAMGAGTVTVFFMMDIVEAVHQGFPQGTNGVATDETRAAPATGDQLLVANHIFPLRPVTALVYAAAPVKQTVAFTIANTTSNDQRTAIEAAIDEVFIRTAEPGGTVDILTIQAAVASVPGAEDDGVTITTPAVNIVAGAAVNLLVRGAMTYT